jgi:UDP-glucose 4-epimerase
MEDQEASMSVNSARGTVAVIGGRGFIGRGLVPALEAAGWTVTVLGRKDRLVDWDGRLAPALAAAGTIVYLANSINPAIAEAEPARVAADMAAFRQFVEGLRRSAGSWRVVLPSSGGTVYDTRDPPPYREDSRVGAKSTYGQAKLAMEELLRDVASPRCRPVVLRIANVYGPGQRASTGQGVVANWLHAVSHGTEVVLYGAGASITRDFVYIDDALQAFLHAIEAPAPPGLVNIGSGTPTSLATLAAVVARVVDPLPFRVRHEPARSFDAPHNYLSIDRAAVTLGWKPEVPLLEGVARTWRAVKGTGSGGG